MLFVYSLFLDLPKMAKTFKNDNFQLLEGPYAMKNKFEVYHVKAIYLRINYSFLVFSIIVK